MAKIERRLNRIRDELDRIEDELDDDSNEQQVNTDAAIELIKNL